MEEVPTFKKNFDEVLLVASILKRLNAGNLTSLNERIKTQKMQYLAQIFNVTPIYPFNLYIHGPYSPELASDLFYLKNRNAHIKTQKFASDELENTFFELSKFVNNKTTRELELIATFHWLQKKACLSLKEIEAKLKYLKGATHDEIERTDKFVSDLP